MPIVGKIVVPYTDGFGPHFGAQLFTIIPALGLQRCALLLSSKPWRGTQRSAGAGESKPCGKCPTTLQSSKGSLVGGEAEIDEVPRLCPSVCRLVCLQRMRTDFGCFLLPRSVGAPRLCPSWNCSSVTKFVTPGPGATVPLAQRGLCSIVSRTHC